MRFLFWFSGVPFLVLPQPAQGDQRIDGQRVMV
jgi:hypothetical protein